jgi:hypothetical protein
MAGTHNLILRARQGSNTWSAATDHGNLTVQTPPGPPAIPQTVSITPNNGTIWTGSPFAITGTARHGSGWQQLVRTDLVIANSYQAGLTGCWLVYHSDTNTLYLRSDTGAYMSAGAPGSGTTSENSSCILEGASSSVVTDGTDLSVSFYVTLKNPLVGSRSVILRTREGTNTWSPATSYGTINVQQGQVPVTVSVTPNDATTDSGTPIELTARVRHGAGWAELVRTDLVVSETYSGGLEGCWVVYHSDTNTLYLRSDTGSYLSAGAPGSGTTRENSNCRLDGAGSSVATAGTDLYVTFRITPKDPMVGVQNLILRTRQGASIWSTANDHGNLTIEQGSGVPSIPQPVSVSPSNASVAVDQPTQFDTTVRHGAGWEELTRTDLVVSETYSAGLSGCWLVYHIDTNTLYLRLADGTYISAGPPGSANVVENDNCLLDASATSVESAGTDFLVHFGVTFKEPISGNQNLFVRTREGASLWSAAVDMGNVSIE